MAQRTHKHGHRGAASPVKSSAGSGAHTADRTVKPAPTTMGDTTRWGRHRVLLLNSTYEPLTVLPVRRAVILLLCGKTDVVHSKPAGPIIHSATRVVVVPSVMRLRTYVRIPYRARIPMTRTALMHRDRFRCAYCEAKADTVDHVVPRSRGGQHNWDNCVAACSKCNHRKADKLLAELGWTLRIIPQPPQGQQWRLLGSIKELDPAWARYLGEAVA